MQKNLLNKLKNSLKNKMFLTTYKSRRKFSGKEKTAEPEGRIAKKKGKRLVFVIHKHWARNLHWDLRLEMNGVLASWAVPKSPEDLGKKGVKRLAVQVEDHPLEYATFKGTIPEGNYGAGKVEIWDKGTYTIKSKDEKKIEFELGGKKLKGNFVLIKTGYVKNGWLWFKI